MPFLATLATMPAAASDKCNSYNYADRKGYILNFAPGLQITHFGFCNSDERDSRYSLGRFTQQLSWKNVGNIPIVAYELHVIQFDPFDRELIGSKAIMPGIDSAKWKHLEPGFASSRTGCDRSSDRQRWSRRS